MEEKWPQVQSTRQGLSDGTWVGGGQDGSGREEVATGHHDTVTGM